MANYFELKHTYVGFVKAGSKFVALDSQYEILPSDVVAVSFPAVGRAVLRTSSVGYSLKYPDSVNVSEPVRGHSNVSHADSPQVVNFQPSVRFQYAVHSSLEISKNFTTASVKKVSVTVRNRFDSVDLEAHIIVQDIPSGLKLLLPAALTYNRTVNLTGALELGTNVTFTFDTGDGNPIAEGRKAPWLTHVYNSTGSKTVRLTATNKVCNDQRTYLLAVWSGLVWYNCVTEMMDGGLWVGMV